MSTSAQANVNPRLKALTDAGVSVWLDQIRRSLVEGGELERLVNEDSLRGLTSNPSIFEKAILGSSDYDDELRELAHGNADAGAIFETLAIRDLQGAADVLSGVHESSGGRDGFVSMEVMPELAHQTEQTLAAARAYFSRLERSNAMIKIPGTPEGVPAIEEAIYEGININVTLLFAVSAYEAVVEAYMRGLERRLDEGKSLDINSVASFFVSRLDTAVDKELDQLGREDLKGTAAIANARLAYMRFQELFSGERWEKLAAAGAAVQRPLWASTGTKNPHYSDTLYVDNLVGPHTVNTMPMATLMAVGDHSEPVDHSAAIDPEPALTALHDAGIDLDAVTAQLLADGVEQFEVAMRGLLDGIDQRRAAVRLGTPTTIQVRVPEALRGPVSDREKRAISEEVAPRIWRHDASLWGGPGVPEIENRLGWLTVSEAMLEQAPDLHEFADQVRSEGYTDAVLLGMGGSSLGPEVIRRSFGDLPDGLKLHVLDSTHPDEVLAVEDAVDLSKTLFIVSSKSGGTIETISHYRYFASKCKPEQFVVVTDPGSPLEQIAKDDGLRRCFLNPPEIGGRYSVLSLFGLVPAVLMGVNIEALLHGAQVGEQNCAHYDSSESNSGLWLGAAIGELALQGRDKLTLVVSDPIASFGLWAEQLVAESTGKQGRGILPVADEPLASDPAVYGDDRVFAYLRNGDNPSDELDKFIALVGDAGHPTVTLRSDGAANLGRLFFVSEFAIAVSGWALEINPFDQPNVQEAKDNTKKVLDSGSIPSFEPASDDALRAS
jgi:transaldolase / glucose-6-phosphate isomerase